MLSWGSGGRLNMGEEISVAVAIRSGTLLDLLLVRSISHSLYWTPTYVFPTPLNSACTDVFLVHML